MRYLMLIHQGSAPTPDDPDAWASVSPEDQQAVYAGYQALNSNPGVTHGERMAAPADATTVRVKDGETLVTDGPYAETKDAVGGYFFLEADDLDAAIALAAEVPAARMGGGIEIRPIVG